MRLGLSLLGVERQLGGNFQYAFTMLRALADLRDHELVVFYDRRALESEGELNLSDVEYVYVGSRVDPLGLLRRVPQVLYGVGNVEVIRRLALGRYAALDEHKCDVIFHPYWKVSAYITRTPAIVAVHDCAPRDAPHLMPRMARWKLDMLISAIARHARFILADSEHGRVLLYEHYGVALERSISLPFRPPEYLARSSPRPQADVLRTYGLEPGYLFLPGRWNGYKNTERVLDALQRLSLRGLDWLRLVLVGLREHEICLAQGACERRDLVERVCILGFVPDEHMAPLYRGALALIFPTLLGPTSIPVSEALALGCPVITSNISGYPTQVGDAGILVDPYDTDSIADGIERLARDAELRAELRRRGLAVMGDTTNANVAEVLLRLATEAVEVPKSSGER